MTDRWVAEVMHCTTAIADKRRYVWLELEFKIDDLAAMSLRIYLLAEHDLLVNLCTMVQGHPDAAKLGHRAEARSLQLVKKVLKIVAAFDEVGGVWIYRKLDLT